MILSASGVVARSLRISLAGAALFVLPFAFVAALRLVGSALAFAGMVALDLRVEFAGLVGLQVDADADGAGDDGGAR